MARLFGSMRVNEKNNLEIGKCDVVELAKTYGTPLYVVDEMLVRENFKLFLANFKNKEIKTEVIYASKAFLNLGMCEIVKSEGVSLDVVSGGELYTALKANFPVDKIYMHGNNKTVSELEYAVESSVGTIIVDNESEFLKLSRICQQKGRVQKVLLRLNPGIDAHTHEYIQTANNNSKFGVSIFAKSTLQLIDDMNKSEYINLVGFHSHIGSQIFEEESFQKAADVLIDFMKMVKDKIGFSATNLNIGGGFGVYYSEEDADLDIANCLNLLLKTVVDKAKEVGINIELVSIEPGRSIVANAGTTLYTVGSVKETYGGKKHVFIDGGMTDNPRTALYGAKYESLIASNMKTDEENEIYSVSGKCCESGDVIIHEASLPKMKEGDILAVLSTGAYNYSMASNYNRINRAAVVLVNNAVAKEIVKRESYEDMMRNDITIYD
jgi:diaminopimelate decarboxylase